MNCSYAGDHPGSHISLLSFTMECPVCYCAVASVGLSCGHGLCPDCVKSWYTKSDGDPSCPMCREPLSFCGLRQLKCNWDCDRYDTQCDALFSDLFDGVISIYIQSRMELLDAGVHPRLHKFFIEDLMDSMKDAERKFQVMRTQRDDVDYMRDVFEGSILQYRDFFTPWCDDPVREPVPYLRPVHVF
jgi:hypothetical protein